MAHALTVICPSCAGMSKRAISGSCMRAAKVSIHSCGLSFNVRCARPVKGGRLMALKTIFSPGRGLGGSACIRAGADMVAAGSAVTAFKLPGDFKTNVACGCSSHLAIKISCDLRG